MRSCPLHSAVSGVTCVETAYISDLCAYQAVDVLRYKNYASDRHAVCMSAMSVMSSDFSMSCDVGRPSLLPFDVFAGARGRQKCVCCNVL